MPRQTQRLFPAFILLMIGGCAYFNTYFNANKAYQQGLKSLDRARQAAQARSTAEGEENLFASEFDNAPNDAILSFTRAIEKANQVVVLYPDSRWVEKSIFLMGRAHYLRGTGNDYFSARNRFDVFLLRYPDSEYVPEVHLWLSKSLIKLKEYDQALESLNHVLETTDDTNLRAQAYKYMGDMAKQKNDHKNATLWYALGVKQNPKGIIRKELLFLAAQSAGSSRDFEKAKTFCNSLLDEELTYVERFKIKLRLASALKYLGSYRFALAHLNDLLNDIRFKAFFAQAEFEIAEVLRLQGKYFEAVDQYKNITRSYQDPYVVGESYYGMAMINDRPPYPLPDGYLPLREEAKKYYQTVSTRYRTARHSFEAAQKLSFILKMEFLRGAITCDQHVLTHLSGDTSSNSTVPPLVLTDLLETPDKESLRQFAEMSKQKKSQYKAAYFVDEVELKFDSTLVDSIRALDSTVAVDSLPLDTLLRIYLKHRTPGEYQNYLADIKARVAAKSAKGGAVGEIKNNELIQKLAQTNSWIQKINTGQAENPSLIRQHATELVASDYLDLANYFNHDLRQYDSSAFYYRKVVNEFLATPSGEASIYTLATLLQKLGQPEYKSLFQRAYETFPESRFAPLAARALGIADTDTIKIKFQQAQDLLLNGSPPQEAIQILTEVARLDNTEYKLNSIYSIGVIYERKLNDPESAFKAYHTLLHLAPDFKTSNPIKAKVERFIKAHDINSDELSQWLDTQFVKVEKSEDIEPSLMDSIDIEEEAGTDTMRTGQSDPSLVDSTETDEPSKQELLTEPKTKKVDEPQQEQEFDNPE